MSAYCDFAPGDPLHGPYHDQEHGFPTADERVLFERLILEINQAGLSWDLMLRKRAGYRAAYAGFDIATVAAFGVDGRARLLADPGIVRNRRKIDAAIENAKRIKALEPEFGGLSGWLEAHHPRTKDEWVRLFRRTFVFTGPEIAGEFLMSVGILPGAHREDCPVFARIAARRPAWMRSGS